MFLKAHRWKARQMLPIILYNKPHIFFIMVVLLMLSYVTNIALVDTPPPFFALFDKVYQYMPWQGYEIIQRDAVHLVTKLYLILAVRIFL